MVRRYNWIALLSGVGIAIGSLAGPAHASHGSADGTASAPVTQPAVKMWEQDLVIPTYVVGDPEPNPMFYFGRASQGAEGRVYPYPLYDTLTDHKVDKTYRMVYLENEYVKVGVLPEIGGRIFSGLDKTNRYDFFYHQHVIKPALIGLIGAWISGGVEWNIPHHHRASTFLPVQYKLQENADGSKTVWVGELELRHRMRWAVGYTLYPGRSYLEVSLRIANRTPHLESMLCFANAAVHANEHYQVLFPPRTQYVTYHSKRQFAAWPIATTRYNQADFTSGVDVSWYKNHIASNSMFAWNYEDDFVAGYDHGREAGTLSVANHHLVPGKKFWTWGNGPSGRAWDARLTDDDGPYVELMVGAYSDNQPDYSWIEPYEVRSFKQYFYPFRTIGGVKNANVDAAVNLDVSNEGEARVGFCTTAAHESATATLRSGDEELFSETLAIDPGSPFYRKVSLAPGTDVHRLRATLEVNGRELIAYTPVKLEPEPMPKEVEVPPPPERIETVEELYLTGMRIEQFHNPSRDPDPYWEEALRRDPGDTRVNTAMGILRLKEARYAEAEAHLRKALERLTDRYTSPKDGEALYYLGVALKEQGKLEEAYDVFYKSTWNAAQRGSGYYSLAEIACHRGDMTTALDHVERSLEAGALNIRALNLKAAVLRHLDRNQQAVAVLKTARGVSDPLDVRSMVERALAQDALGGDPELHRTLRHHPHTGLETLAEYVDAGLWEDAVQLAKLIVHLAEDKDDVSPLVHYYWGYALDRQSHSEAALSQYRRAATQPADYVFPFQNELILVLRRAMKANPNDARAPYYLGNLLYDWQPDEAVELWERSVALAGAPAIAYRNLAVAYSHRGGSEMLSRAIDSLERAIARDGRYALHYFELDRLYEAAGTSAEERFNLLKKHHATIAGRDDALSREIHLAVVVGENDRAIELLTGRRFNVWEGGRLSVADDWTDAHLQRGHADYAAGRYREALANYHTAAEIPENLRADGRGAARRASEIAYYEARAHEALGEVEKAAALYEQAATSGGRGERGGGWGRRGGGANASRSYRARALEKLGRGQEAEAIYRELVEAGRRALERAPEIDFFAKFDQQRSQRSRLADAHYLVALGYGGLGQREKAKQAVRQVLAIDPAHLGARAMKEHLE